MIKLKHFDRVGASLSFLCAIHCAAMPLLLAYLSMTGFGFLLNETYETVFIYFSIALASLTLTTGYHYHHDKRIFVALLSGIGMIILSRHVTGILEPIIAVPGALMIASSHLFSQHLIRHAKGPCPHPHKHD